MKSVNVLFTRNKSSTRYLWMGQTIMTKKQIRQRCAGMGTLVLFCEIEWWELLQKAASGNRSSSSWNTGLPQVQQLLQHMGNRTKACSDINLYPWCVYTSIIPNWPNGGNTAQIFPISSEEEIGSGAFIHSETNIMLQYSSNTEPFTKKCGMMHMHYPEQPNL